MDTGEIRVSLFRGLEFVECFRLLEHLVKRCSHHDVSLGRIRVDGHNPAENVGDTFKVGGTQMGLPQHKEGWKISGPEVAGALQVFCRLPVSVKPEKG